MFEKPDQFDFSKKEDQENFEKLEKNEQEKIRLAAQAEAEWIKRRARESV